jgi:apolipoprotein N-acyltransferase
MNAIDFIKAVLTQLLAASPFLVVLVVGFVFSLVKYRECPKACLLVAIGTSVLFATRIVQAVVFQWLPYMISRQGMSHEVMGQIYGIIGIVMTIVLAVALACILAAVFVGRAKKPAPGAGVPPLS